MVKVSRLNIGLIPGTNKYFSDGQIFFGTTKYFSDGQIFLWLAMQAVSGEWYNEVVVKSLLAQICKSEQL